MLLMLLMATMLVAGTAHGRLVDMKKEIPTLIKRHNTERSNRLLKAADMLEMTWDDDLAKRAEHYADKCRYVHPNVQEYDLGYNLHYEMNFVTGPKSIHRFVNTALKSWTRAKDAFVYSTHCERACTYVQMIQAQTDKIGCAINTCKTLDNGNNEVQFASLLVCFYSPRQPLLESFPFKMGFSCSECPAGAICRNGLCSQLGYEAVPSYVQDSPSDRLTALRPLNNDVTDELSSNEEHYLTATHNRLRESNGLESVEWDPYLERWAQWVINCNVDYPGPRHCYTNFHRLDQGAQVYAVVYDWSSEGENTNVHLDHGCRTPRDVQQCNHYTNILQPALTSMACAAKDCKDNTRQLVCVYDNRNDREEVKPILQTYRPFFVRIKRSDKLDAVDKTS